MLSSEKWKSMGNNLPVIEAVFRLVNAVLDGDCKLYLFGSFARGEERISSDLDIAIDTGEPLPMFRMTDIRSQLEDSNIPFRVDVVDLNQVSESLREQILKDGIQWTERR